MIPIVDDDVVDNNAVAYVVFVHVIFLISNQLLWELKNKLERSIF